MLPIQRLRSESCRERGRDQTMRAAQSEPVPAPAVFTEGHAMTCDSPTCWCHGPPSRVIMSTGARYVIEELEPDGRVRVFRYIYLSGGQ